MITVLKVYWLSIFLNALLVGWTSADDQNNEDKRENTTQATRNHVLQKIMSRTGLFLRIGEDGRVIGTNNCKDEYVLFKTLPVGPNLITIRGAETDLYLSMDGTGRVSARNNMKDTLLCQENFDILWRAQLILPSCFVSLQSLLQIKVGQQKLPPLTKQSTNRIKAGRYLAITKCGRVISSENDTRFKSNFFLIS